jgi:hypothetical protein
MYVRTLIAILIGIASIQTALAGSLSKAKELVLLFQYEEQHREYAAQCLASTKAFRPDKLLDVGPDDLVRPDTKYWPKVLAAYEEYFSEMCAHPTKDEFLDALAAAYSDVLSDSEMVEIIGFYTQPIGRRLIAANQVAVKRVYAEWTRLNSASAPAASEHFYERVRAINDEARRELCRSNSSLERTGKESGCGKASGPAAQLGR